MEYIGLKKPTDPKLHFWFKPTKRPPTWRIPKLPMEKTPVHPSSARHLVQLLTWGDTASESAPVSEISEKFENPKDPDVS